MHSRTLQLILAKTGTGRGDIHRTAIANRGDIRHLIAVASHRGSADEFTGKREDPRFSDRMALEATIDLNDPGKLWFAQLHNISDSGFSFWSKRPVKERIAIFVHEFSGQGLCPWVPGRVTHCTKGIFGYLIGCQLDEAALSK